MVRRRTATRTSFPRTATTSAQFEGAVDPAPTGADASEGGESVASMTEELTPVSSESLVFEATVGAGKFQGNSFIQTAVEGCHEHGVLDMVMLLGDWRFSSHGQTEYGMTVAPELNI